MCSVKLCHFKWSYTVLNFIQHACNIKSCAHIGIGLERLTVVLQT